MIQYPRIIRQRLGDYRVPERAGPFWSADKAQPRLYGCTTLLDLGPGFHDRFCTTWLGGDGSFNWSATFTCPIEAEVDFARRANDVRREAE